MILNFTAELLRMYIDMRLLLDGKFEKPKYYRTHICSPGVKTDPLVFILPRIPEPPSSPDLKLHVEYRAIILKETILGANYDLQLGGFSF